MLTVALALLGIGSLLGYTVYALHCSFKQWEQETETLDARYEELLKLNNPNEQGTLLP